MPVEVPVLMACTSSWAEDPEGDVARSAIGRNSDVRICDRLILVPSTDIPSKPTDWRSRCHLSFLPSYHTLDFTIKLVRTSRILIWSIRYPSTTARKLQNDTECPEITVGEWHYHPSTGRYWASPFRGSPDASRPPEPPENSDDNSGPRLIPQTHGGPILLGGHNGHPLFGPTNFGSYPSEVDCFNQFTYGQ